MIAVLLFRPAHVLAEEASAASPAETHAQQKRVMVFAVQVINLDPGVASILTDKLSEGLALNPGYRVISDNEITSLLGLEAKKQMMGCSEGGCMAELAGALDAELLITVKVVRFGNKFTLSGHLSQVADTQVLRRESLELEDESKLPETMRLLGARLAQVSDVTELETKLGVVGEKRWRVSLSGMSAGFGAVGRVALNSANSGSSWTATYDNIQPITGGGGVSLGRTFSRWWSMDVGLGYTDASVQVQDMPIERVLFIVRKNEPGGQDVKAELFGNSEFGKGCLWDLKPDTSDTSARSQISGADQIPEKQDQGTFRINTDKDGTGLPNKGVCYQVGSRTDLHVDLLLTAHLTPWLSAELGPRVGVFMASWDWSTVRQDDNDRQQVAGMLLGGLLSLRTQIGALWPTWPDWLSLRLEGSLQYLRSFNQETLTEGSGNLGTPGSKVPVYTAVLPAAALSLIAVF